ncbi:hypothetical protein predicted by Glimmer/Critica [Acetobacter ghanensis]|uniref:Uncharacterized protein n=1 Tax=Acetobacter ghanensis TaxID=431306 RepID=A0A0U4Y9J5_9PROT|nr:hypothetical protein predicted by Glimmer/Critica [Acetobacter ghanensis]
MVFRFQAGGLPSLHYASVNLVCGVCPAEFTSSPKPARRPILHSLYMFVQPAAGENPRKCWRIVAGCKGAAV